MPRKKTFKKRILECIGDQKPTPWGLSIGLGSGTITRIFKEDKIPTSPHLITISKALGKSIDWLLTGEEPSGTQSEEYSENRMPHGKVIELEAGNYTGKHRQYVEKLLHVLDGYNNQNKKIIKLNLDVMTGGDGAALRF